MSGPCNWTIVRRTVERVECGRGASSQEGGVRWIWFVDCAKGGGRRSPRRDDRKSLGLTRFSSGEGGEMWKGNGRRALGGDRWGRGLTTTQMGMFVRDNWEWKLANGISPKRQG